MNNKYTQKETIIRRIIISITAAFILGAGIWSVASQSFRGGITQDTEDTSYEAKESESVESESMKEFTSQAEETGSTSGRTEKLLCVYICGAIREPSVYELPEGSRIFDAIQRAGGLAANASTTQLNQAEPLYDGQMIYVPYEGETLSHSVSSEGNGSNESGGSTGLKVDLNTADVTLLMTLPGIGQSKAEAIISYRNEQGLFQSIEEIKKVSGIGDSSFNKLKTYICVS